MNKSHRSFCCVRQFSVIHNASYMLTASHEFFNPYMVQVAQIDLCRWLHSILRDGQVPCRYPHPCQVTQANECSFVFHVFCGTYPSLPSTFLSPRSVVWDSTHSQLNMALLQEIYHGLDPLTLNAIIEIQLEDSAALAGSAKGK